MDTVMYIHGKGGNAAEAEHYNLLFSSCNVIGLEYKSFTPWEAGMEIHAAVAELNAEYDRIILIANSIGAYFSMNADIERYVTHAFRYPLRKRRQPDIRRYNYGFCSVASCGYYRYGKR